MVVFNIPVVPTDDEARKHNENLPGMGQVRSMKNLFYLIVCKNVVFRRCFDYSTRSSISAGLKLNTKRRVFREHFLPWMESTRLIIANAHLRIMFWFITATLLTVVFASSRNVTSRCQCIDSIDQCERTDFAKTFTSSGKELIKYYKATLWSATHRQY